MSNLTEFLRGNLPEQPNVTAAHAATELKHAVMPHSELLASEELERNVIKYAQERGRALAAEGHVPERIEKLDKEFRALIEKHSPMIQAVPGFGAHLEQLARINMGSSRYEVFQKTLDEICRDIGISKELRGREESGAPRAEQRYSDYVRGQWDLIMRDPQLSQGLDEARARGMRTARERLVDIEERAVNIFLGTHHIPYLKSEKTVCAALSGLNIGDLALLRSIFRERYDRDLDDLCARRFKGLKLSRIQALLRGDEIAAQSDALCAVLKSHSIRRTHRVIAFLQGIPDEQKGAIERDFNRRHKSKFDGMNLEQALQARCSEEKSAYVRALSRQGYGTRVLLHAIDQALENTSAFTRESGLVKMCQSLERLSAEEMHSLKGDCEYRFSVPLRQRIEEISKGPLREWALALCDGDRDLAEIAKLRCAITNAPGLWVGELAWFKEPADLVKLVQGYQDHYERDFWKDLEKSVSFLGWTRHMPPAPRWTGMRGFLDGQYELMEKVFKEGRLSRAEMLFDCMYGPGTDEAGILKLLTGLSKAEIAELREEFDKLFTEKLRAGFERALRGELSGQDEFDTFQALAGKIEAVEEKFEQFKARYLYEEDSWLANVLETLRHERQGVVGWSVNLLKRGARRVLRNLNQENQCLERDNRDVSEYFREHIQDKCPRPDQLQHFDTLLERGRISCESFRLVKNNLARVVSDLTSKAAAIATFVVSWQMAAPFPWYVTVPIVALCTGVAKGATSMVSKMMIKGRDVYGREEMITDGALAVIEGASVFVGKAPGAREMVRKIARGVTKFGFSKAVRLTEKLSKHSKHAHLAMNHELAQAVLEQTTKEQQRIEPSLERAMSAGSTGRHFLDDSFDSMWSGLGSTALNDDAAGASLH